MTARPQLPIFENRDDARRYLMAIRAVVAGVFVLLAGVVISFPLGGGILPILLASAGILLALAGQALYLALNARVWTRHHPNDPWDWRTARGFYEGTFRETVARARAMSRGR